MFCVGDRKIETMEAMKVWCSEQKSIPATLISDVVNMARGPRGCVIPVQSTNPSPVQLYCLPV
jgi:hypothetical protein